MTQIFLNFSNFSVLHETMSNYRIGTITMKVIDFEIQRHQIRVGDTGSCTTEREMEKSKRAMRDAMRKQDKLL